MRTPSPFRPLPLLLLCLPAAAQSIAVPVQLARVPGNGALALPGRWTQGLLQTLVVGDAVPAALRQQRLKRLTLRRPAFLDEPVYTSVQQRLRLAIAGTNLSLKSLGKDMESNRALLAQAVAAYQPDPTKNQEQDPRPTDLTEVFPSQAVSLQASTAPLAADAVGADLADLPFLVPFLFRGPALFVELQSTNDEDKWEVRNQHWADALYMPGGDSGLASRVGGGGCGSAKVARPMLLEPGTDTAALGATLALRLTGVRAGAPVWLMAGGDPLSGARFGFGASLAPQRAPGCHLWAWPDATVTLATTGFGMAAAVARPLLAGVPNRNGQPGGASTAAGGAFTFSYLLPSQLALRGQVYSMQALAYDPTQNPAGIATSSGVVVVLGSLGLDQTTSGVATVMAPSPTGTPARWVSPWAPFPATMPVLRFGL